MSNTKKTESELIIEQLARNTTELLNDYWKRVETLAVGVDKIQVGILHSVSTESGKLKTKSTISFGRRIKASVEQELDPNQIEMEFSDNGVTPPPAAKVRRLHGVARVPKARV